MGRLLYNSYITGRRALAGFGRWLTCGTAEQLSDLGAVLSADWFRKVGQVDNRSALTGELSVLDFQVLPALLL